MLLYLHTTITFHSVLLAIICVSKSRILNDLICSSTRFTFNLSDKHVKSFPILCLNGEVEPDRVLAIKKIKFYNLRN